MACIEGEVTEFVQDSKANEAQKELDKLLVDWRERWSTRSSRGCSKVTVTRQMSL